MAATLGAIAWFTGRPRTSINLAEAQDIALAHAIDYVTVQREAGFIVALLGIVFYRQHTGKPPGMPQNYWDLILRDLTGTSQTLWYVQVNIAYTPPEAGGGENLIYGIEQNGNIVFLAATREELNAWF